MDVLLSFGAALVSLRLAGLLARGRRFAWAGGLLAFGAAAAAMAWGSAHGWDARAFRVYYLAGALLSAPLLGVGSLSCWGNAGRRRSGSSTSGLAVGVAVAMPVHGVFVGTSVPHAQDHLDWLPRVVAIAGSSLGTLAVVVVAVATIRAVRSGTADPRRGRGGSCASALTQTAVSAAAACFALAAVLLYAGATIRRTGL